jgi:type VI secretion system protein ImpK
MSDQDDDKNPNRTVFRPSPLQGLRGGQPGGAPAGGTQFIPAAPAAPPPGAAPVYQAPPQAAAPRPRPVLSDDDIPRPPPAGRPRNPMLEAAAPLLALIASVRAGRAQIAIPELHQKASRAAQEFDQALVAAGYSTETRQRARYAVCATVDDVAQNLPGLATDGAEWARRSLVVQAFNENIGGDRFWQLLEEMLARPAENAELIELYHACLAVGFEGRYRVAPNGKNKLHEIMTSSYAALTHPRGVSQTEVSPRWKGAPKAAAKVSFWGTILLAAAIAFALLLVAFIAFRLVLVQTGQPSVAALRAVNPGQPLRLSRVAAPPPPSTSTQLERLKTFLAPEIAQHLVVVEQDAQSIRVRTTVGQLFKSGSDVLEAGRQDIFKRIAAAVETEKGPVRVEGHADSDKLASITFPDNVALSKARAETAANILKSVMTDDSRVSTEGFGDSQPIASNATPDGKSLNRRVEIVIPRVE